MHLSLFRFKFVVCAAFAYPCRPAFNIVTRHYALSFIIFFLPIMLLQMLYFGNCMLTAKFMMTQNLKCADPFFLSRFECVVWKIVNTSQSLVVVDPHTLYSLTSDERMTKHQKWWCWWWVFEKVFDSKEKWEEPTDVSQDVEPLHYQRY